MQLVRVIEAGRIDIDGDGFPDLDPARIYCFGSSQGGSVTSVFLGVESGVRAGVITVGGGARVDRRLGPTGRSGVGEQLASRIPSLLNPPGLSTIGGFPVNPPLFDENLPLRNQPPVINTVRGALEIQGWIEHSEWVTQAGNPVAYAPYIRRRPLAGQASKAVIVQFGKGDQAVAGPTTTAFLRAGELADRATYVRHDLAVAEDPALPRSPHAFLFRIDHPNALARAMALSGQEQVGQFFSTDGLLTIHPNPQRFFEVPVVLPLSEDLFFIR
jgi:dienelactone hydrolase